MLKTIKKGLFSVFVALLVMVVLYAVYFMIFLRVTDPGYPKIILKQCPEQGCNISGTLNYDHDTQEYTVDNGDTIITFSAEDVLEIRR